MNKLLIFAGTTEGRELAEYLDRQGLGAIVCVATEYGEALVDEKTSRHRVMAKRLDKDEMIALFKAEGITHVVDATHPYAAVVTANIKEACKAAGSSYLRLLRAASDDQLSDWVSVESVDAAVEFLKDKEGHILAATGSKELGKYCAIPDYQNRVTARILSTMESMQLAEAAGFAGKNLICMQGPFDEEINTAMLRSTGSVWMVTKESGRAGGFPEKVAAAKAAGARLVVVGRPAAEEGYGPEQIRRMLVEEFSLKSKREITLVGIGMGTKKGLTIEAYEAIQNADVLIGAERMLKVAGETSRPTYQAYLADEIKAYVDAHPEYEKFAVLLSGDVGFYSGAKKLEEVFAGDTVHVINGISSVVYLCGKMHTSWEDVKLISIHGRGQNLIAAVKENAKVFALVGKQDSFRDMCRELIRYSLGSVIVHAGCDLGYETERIVSGSPEELLSAESGDLVSVLIENENARCLATHGLDDEVFQRAKVPMTKAEVRFISLSKLMLTPDSVVYDVGAGTGSVSIEMALRAKDGTVYAIEKKEEAVELIGENARLLGAGNLKVIEGLAPEALMDLPAPTHAFIGGSSGNLREIMEVILSKNDRARIVINAIALETVHEALECLKELPVCDTDIACVNISKSKTLGRYHMMMGQNPVYVISCTGSPRKGDS